MRKNLTLLALVVVPAAARAQGFIEHVAPPVVERGKTTRVTFAGHGFAPGLDLWHSLPAVALTAKPVESASDRLVFDITTTPDAPTGVCGVRAATRDGLTNAHLLLVDDLPATPRDGDGVMSLKPPAAAWGTFNEAAVDRYRLTAAAGERLGFEVVANRFGKDADPLVTIRDAAGKWVAECDNSPGLFFDGRFEHEFREAGTYTIEVRDARFRASPDHKYVLRVGRFPAVPPVPTPPGPVAVGHDPDPTVTAGFGQATSPAAVFGFWLSPIRGNPFLPLDRHLAAGRARAVPAAIPGTLAGVFRTPGKPHAFVIRLEKGQPLFLRGETKSVGSPVELDLVLTDRSGREVRRGTEVPNRDEVTLDFTAPAAGDYGLFVRDQLRDAGPAHAYRITARTTPFPPRLTAEVEGLTVPRGSHQPVPIAVARPPGAAGVIRLSLAGAPPGLRLTPAEIGEKESAVVCKLEADSTAPLGVHTVQIIVEAGPDSVPVRTQPLIDKRYKNVDLIPLALRDDQLRLPPSLTDRFAVQVTPPAPFTAELPEPVVTLPRFQQAGIPVSTTRAPGFDGPIRFEAMGGQLGPKAEGRTRVYAEFPEAAAGQPGVTGVVKSLILTNTAKARIDLTATGTHAGRTVTLTRCFDLDIVPAFKVTAGPAKVAVFPGEVAKVRLAADRVKSFAGPVTVRFQPHNQGFIFPDAVTIPPGPTGVEVEIVTTADAGPRRQQLQVTATGTVDGFEEEARATPVEVEVKKVEPVKKK